MRKALSTALLSFSLILGPLPTIARADSSLDYSIPDGHFYTQTNGTSRGARGGGYTISDAHDVPFWTFFSENGGVDLLGYPVSRRFLWDGYVCQATQRAVLQWNPATKQVQLANVFDYLSQIGKDDWLLSAQLAPRPERAPNETDSLPFPVLAHLRFAWLYRDPAIFHRYFSTPDYYSIYGLPTSPVVDLGPYYAERFQRVVMYHWKFQVPWADDRGTSVGLAGDLLKEVGMIPAAAARPEEEPGHDPADQALPAIWSPKSSRLLAASAGPQSTVQGVTTVRADVATLPVHSPREVQGPILVGVSTWYGGNFQGLLMSDGRPYNMWNPRTAASNSYPLGTWIRVTRLTTGKSIVVEVTDRGAFSYPNVADLSYAAFAQLADPAVGVIGVRIEPVSGPI
jgi:hypothetical protein